MTSTGKASLAETSATHPGDCYAFLLIHGHATLRFDMPVDDARHVSEELGKAMRDRMSWLSEEQLRASLRQSLRDSMLDNEHLDPERSSHVANLVVHYLLTSKASREAPDLRGLIVEIQEFGGGQSNFRTIVSSDPAYVDKLCEQVRRKSKLVVKVDPSAKRRTAHKPPRDPSLDPPPHPRPDRFLPALDRVEKEFGVVHFRESRPCLMEAPRFVFRSRQLAEGSRGEIDPSLSALAEFGRLRLPYPRIWVETRDHIETWGDEGRVLVPTLIGISAWQESDTVFAFQGFSDKAGERTASAFIGRIDTALFREDRRPLALELPPVPEGYLYDESPMRALTRAACDCLLELLFLLNTSGVAVERVPAGARASGKGTPGGRQAPQRGRKKRKDWDRGYTVVRVPLTWIPRTGPTAAGHSGNITPGAAPDTEAMTTAGGARTGRWVKPHVRRAHVWGRHTRPLEEQRLIEATLVGASRLVEGESPEAPVYIV